MMLYSLVHGNVTHFCCFMQELFLEEIAVRAHAVMQEDQQRKGNVMDYKDVGGLPELHLI